jgi:tetratricopeptide (TPR) repeat protein
MLERLTEGVSATVKFIAGLVVFVYLIIGAIYFIAPSRCPAHVEALYALKQGKSEALAGHVEEAVRNFNKSAPDEALADYNKAIEGNSKNAGAFNGRVHVFYLRGDYARADADYLKVIELAPSAAAACADGMRGDPDYSKGGKIDPACAKDYLQKIDEIRRRLDKGKSGIMTQPGK